MPLAAMAILPCIAQANPPPSSSVEGTVDHVDTESHGLWLRLDNTPGDELTFYRAGSGDLAIGYVGTRIQGQAGMVENEVFLEDIWPADPILKRIEQDVNRQLRRDTVTRGRKVYRTVGEYIPDFALYDQNGQLVRPSTLKGRYWILNFIFTRCGQAMMCPAATQRMTTLQENMDSQNIKNLELVSITLDPSFDTPGILRNYSDARRINASTFHFLTGNEQAIQDLKRQIGILSVEEDGTLNHTMATLLIDPNGKILYRKDGSQWEASDFLQRVAAGNS